MISKSSLFLSSLLYPLLLPHRRQQLTELFEELCEEVPDIPCAQDILALWLEEFGVGGVVLGNVALFGIGLLLMIGIDLLLHSYGSPTLTLLLGAFSTLFCIAKFRSTQPTCYLLIGLLCLYWMISGFWWSIVFLFLIYFTNMGLRYGRGGNQC